MGSSHAVHPICFRLYESLPLQDDQLNDADIKSVGELGHGVFKVQMKDGKNVVVRIGIPGPEEGGANFNDTHFEVFATDLSGLLGRPLPVPVRLSPPLSKKFSAALRTAKDRTPARAFPKRGIKDATVLPLYPGTTGDMHLAYEDKITGMNFRKVIRNQMRRGTPAPTEIFLSDVRAHWDKLLTPEERINILQDLKQLFPGERITEAGLEKWLIKIWSRPEAQRLHELPDLALNHLPVEARTELAEYWALHVVLGITDFHYNNWLMHEGHVIPIDFAYRSRFFNRGESGINFEQQHPFLEGDMSAEQVERFKKYLSPGFVEKLKTLSVDDVRRSAEASGVPLNEYQASGVVERARKLTVPNL